MNSGLETWLLVKVMTIKAMRTFFLNRGAKVACAYNYSAEGGNRDGWVSRTHWSINLT